MGVWGAATGVQCDELEWRRASGHRHRRSPSGAWETPVPDEALCGQFMNRFRNFGKTELPEIVCSIELIV